MPAERPRAGIGFATLPSVRAWFNPRLWRADQLGVMRQPLCPRCRFIVNNVEDAGGPIQRLARGLRRVGHMHKRADAIGRD